MKRLILNILSFIGLGIAILVSLIFAFLEMRSLVAGDFTLMNNQAIHFVRNLFRGIYYLSIIVVSIFVIYYIVKRKMVDDIVLYIDMALAVGSFMSLFFYEYYVGIVIIVINLIVFLIALPNSSLMKKKD